MYVLPHTHQKGIFKAERFKIKMVKYCLPARSRPVGPLRYMSRGQIHPLLRAGNHLSVGEQPLHVFVQRG